MQWFQTFKNWWSFVNRYQWATDVRCGCELALRSFLAAECAIKERYQNAAPFFEVRLRELERDHRILVARTKRFEEIIKDGSESDGFHENREEILTMLCSAKGKYNKIERDMAEREKNL